MKWIGTVGINICFTGLQTPLSQSLKWKLRGICLKLFTPGKVLLNNIKLKPPDKPAWTLVSHSLTTLPAVIWLLDEILKKGKRNSVTEILISYWQFPSYCLVIMLQFCPLRCWRLWRWGSALVVSRFFYSLVFPYDSELNNLQLSHQYFYFIYLRMNPFSPSFSNCAFSTKLL